MWAWRGSPGRRDECPSRGCASQTTKGIIQPSPWETEGRRRPGFMALPGTRRHCVSGTEGTGDRGGGGPRAIALLALRVCRVPFGCPLSGPREGARGNCRAQLGGCTRREQTGRWGAEGRLPAHALSPCLGRLTYSARFCYLANEDGEGVQELCKNTCWGRNLFHRPVGQRRAAEAQRRGRPWFSVSQPPRTPRTWVFRARFVGSGPCLFRCLRVPSLRVH